MASSLEKFSRRFDSRWVFYNRIVAGKKILELGCGSGINYENMLSLGCTAEYHGVDILPAEQVPRGIIYLNVDLNENTLPYPDESFDGIILTHVIEHLRFPFDLGIEIHRVLKTGGRLYVETPNWISMFVPSFMFKPEAENPFNFFDDHTHIRPYTKYSLFQFVFSACNLKVDKVSTTRNWPRIPWDLLKILDGLVRGRRDRVINAFWSIYGWCIYGTGVKIR